MGVRALEVGVASTIAAEFFEHLRLKRALSERMVMRGAGTTAKSRANRLLNGSAVWTLEDIQKFSDFYEIDVAEVLKRVYPKSEFLNQNFVRYKVKENMYSIKEVAEYFNIPETYVKKMVREGSWPHWRPEIGSRYIRFSRQHLQEIEQTHQAERNTNPWGRVTRKKH